MNANWYLFQFVELLSLPPDELPDFLLQKLVDGRIADLIFVEDVLLMVELLETVMFSRNVDGLV